MDFINLIPTPTQIFRYALHFLASFTGSLNINNMHTRPGRRTTRDYDVDPETGFFPPQPLPHLPLDFIQWEVAFSEAQQVLKLGEDDSQIGLDSRAAGESWRAGIRSLPILGVTVFESDIRLQQRAHMVLSWLVNFYVHSIPDVAPELQVRIPAALAVPLVHVSKMLGMAPVLTYADTVLWNYELIDPRAPFSMENMRPAVLFSGTDDERAFYEVAARTDWRGIEFLNIVDDFHSLPNYTDMTSISKLSRDLTRLTTVINDISDIIQSVTSVCDPHVFHWAVRPWFKGSSSEADSARWIYEGVENPDNLLLSGPSNGQSSVMHALDLFLDIDHKLEKTRLPAPSKQNQEADLGFMARMKKYMPAPHRQYLADIATPTISIRELALRTPALREPYDIAIAALNRLRTLHIRVAVLYIVSMARSKPGSRAGCPVSAMMDKMDKNRTRSGARGTGGNDLSALLKAGRDATRRAMVKDNLY